MIAWLYGLKATRRVASMQVHRPPWRRSCSIEGPAGIAFMILHGACGPMLHNCFAVINARVKTYDIRRGCQHTRLSSWTRMWPSRVAGVNIYASNDVWPLKCSMWECGATLLFWKRYNASRQVLDAMWYKYIMIAALRYPLNQRYPNLLSRRALVMCFGFE